MAGVASADARVSAGLTFSADFAARSFPDRSIRIRANVLNTFQQSHVLIGR
jgi:hypothetical protein